MSRTKSHIKRKTFLVAGLRRSSIPKGDRTSSSCVSHAYKFGKKEIHLYKYVTNSFLRKTDEANTNQMENLMKALVSHSFETNILCVNVGYTKVRQLFKVVIRERKRKDMIF